jgi:hypothetical protein
LRYSKWLDTFQTALMCEWNWKLFTITDHTEDTDIKLLSKDVDNSGNLPQTVTELTIQWENDDAHLIPCMV